MEDINKVKTKSTVSGQRQKRKYNLLLGGKKIEWRLVQILAWQCLYWRPEFQNILRLFNFFVFLQHENLDYVTYKIRSTWKSIVYGYYFHNTH